MTAAEWPDRFVYVTTASQGAAVNHAPLHRAGIGRLVGLLILCPLSSPNRPSDSDRTQCLAPADRLLRTARDVFDVLPDHIHIEKGHADLLGDWTSVLHTAADMARGLDASVVFNVTAGRKPAILGALIGMPRGPDVPQIVMISIGLDSTIRQVVITPGGLEERPLPGLCEDTLDVYLGTYGLKVPASPKRDHQNAFLATCDAACEEIGRALRNRDFCNRFGKLQKEVAGLKAPPPLTISLNAGEEAALGDLLSSLLGASLEEGNLTLTSEDARGFLGGYWLEAMALRALEPLRQRHPALQMERGLEVADVRAPRGKTETDFDIALLHRDRFALIECKAGLDPSLVRKGITHLSHYRSLLSAQAGRAWLLAPLLKNPGADGLKSHAEDRGVTLLTGPDAIDILAVRVADWLGPPPTPRAG